jgi:beta-lactamase class A
VLLITSICINYFVYEHYKINSPEVFPHLSPAVAWMNVNTFLNVQSKYSVQFYGLRKEMLAISNSSNVSGHYGIYFEDLNTGAWVGIYEKDLFIPESLLKVPVMIAVLKKIELGELNLNQKIVLTSSDLDSRSGTLASKGAGYAITLKDLLVELIKDSDNTALNAIHRTSVSDFDVVSAWIAMGLPEESGTVYLGPKQYSNILRSLYYSSYLREDSSELALSLMSTTDYSSKIPAGVPSNIPISHKVGFLYNLDGLNTYHDCGIIYHPAKPYILCIMSQNASEAESTQVMSNISHIVYNYVDNLSK